MRTTFTLLMIFLGLDSMALSESEKITLDRYLVGKRIVFLGEPDHWIKDKTDYQNEYLAHLISKGFNVIGNERSYVDSTFVNHYIQTGDRDYLKKCAECGYIGVDWPKRKMSGTLDIPEDFKSQYLEGMQKNDQGFYEFLRELRSKYEFTYFGYDVDKIPDIIFDKLSPFFEALKNSDFDELKDFSMLLQRSKEGDFAVEASNIKLALQRLPVTNMSRVFDDSQFIDFKSLLVQLEESVKFASIAYNDPDSDKLMAAYGDREKTMFRLADEVLSRPEAKVVLLGHNAHLSKDHMEYRRIYEVEGSQVEAQGWLTLGAYLHQKYKGETLAIWMLYDSGFHSAPFCEIDFPCRVDSLEGTLEWWLTQNRGDGLYEASDLVNEADLAKIKWRENGLNTVTGDFEEVVDLIFFQKSVSGL